MQAVQVDNKHSEQLNFSDSKQIQALEKLDPTPPQLRSLQFIFNCDAQ